MSLTVGVVVSAQRDEVLESGERDEREALHARRNFRQRRPAAELTVPFFAGKGRQTIDVASSCFLGLDVAGVAKGVEVHALTGS